MGKTYCKGLVLSSALYGARVINRHERRRNRQVSKSREHCNEKNLESTKVGCTGSNKRRYIGISNMEARIARRSFLYLRRIQKGNNEVLKKVLEDSKKSKKNKWWETTRKYMNWAQIEERGIKEKTAKEIRGRIAKVVEDEWREELENKNSLGINRRFKKEMKEKD